jgi:hypothetical protein
MPPPRVSPPIPVWLTIPPVTASPAAWVARSRSRYRQPPWARAVPAAGSTRTPVMADRSITRPSSQTAWPATAWPPPRTETGRSRSRAKRTASRTSATSRQRTTARGRRSTFPFQTRLASS